MSFVPSFPEPSSLRDALVRWPEPATALVTYHEALLRAEDSSLPHAVMELIAAYVSHLNGCRYCRTVHTLVAEKMGFAKGTVERLVAGDLEAVEEKLRPLVSYAEKLTRDPGSVTKQDYDAVLAAGWDERASHELVATVALFNFMNRYIEGLGIELAPQWEGPASDSLAKRGYRPLLRMIESGRTVIP